MSTHTLFAQAHFLPAFQSHRSAHCSPKAIVLSLSRYIFEVCRGTVVATFHRKESVWASSRLAFPQVFQPLPSGLLPGFVLSSHTRALFKFSSPHLLVFFSLSLSPLHPHPHHPHPSSLLQTPSIIRHKRSKAPLLQTLSLIFADFIPVISSPSPLRPPNNAFADSLALRAKTFRPFSAGRLGKVTLLGDLVCSLFPYHSQSIDSSSS